MDLSTVDLPGAIFIAAHLLPPPQEPPVARTPEQFAAASRFAGLGMRLPMRSGQALLRAIVDTEGQVVAVLTPTGSDTTDADRAEAIADAINASGGFGAVRVDRPAAAAE